VGVRVIFRSYELPGRSAMPGGLAALQAHGCAPRVAAASAGWTLAGLGVSKKKIAKPHKRYK
jgi:hypothetical protein